MNELRLPGKLVKDMKSEVINTLLEARMVLDRLIDDEDTIAQIAAAGERLGLCFKNGGRVFSCGNGGSMCDAMHFAEELTGRFRQDRSALPAMAISDPGYLSCVANDLGYEQVFARFIDSHGGQGDCLLAISTSGESQNVRLAVEAARANKLSVIALTGRAKSPIGRLADIDVCTPAGKFADRVQELHIKVIHILIELVERQLFPENYPPDA